MRVASAGSINRNATDDPMALAKLEILSPIS
jgi:hypothetical protein